MVFDAFKRSLSDAEDLEQADDKIIERSKENSELDELDPPREKQQDTFRMMQISDRPLRIQLPRAMDDMRNDVTVSEVQPEERARELKALSFVNDPGEM